LGERRGSVTIKKMFMLTLVILLVFCGAAYASQSSIGVNLEYFLSGDLPPDELLMVARCLE